MNAMNLTPFQRIACMAIKNEITNHGRSIDFQVLGTSEPFLEGQVSNINIWIYEDELGLQSEHVSLQLERPDFDSLDQMLTHFQERLRTLLTNQKAD